MTTETRPGSPVGEYVGPGDVSAGLAGSGPDSGLVG
jgi:hypothetical protein